MSSEKIRVAIAGYGNLGRCAHQAITATADMELVGIFTRRTPESLGVDNVAVIAIDDIQQYQDKIDVLLLCGGSKSDLPEQGPKYAQWFTTVDSFDTHAKIPDYFAAVDQVAKSSNTVSIISTGWDPGLFSLNRMLGEAILPNGATYTFWGKGLSQGHSDAIRRVEGVKQGVQYTIPIEAAVNQVRNGENPDLSTREKHKRVCYIVAEPGFDTEKIRQTIVSMPDYFADYDTEVNFIDAATMAAEHSGMPHGGFVIRSGTTAGDKQIMEFSLDLASNPGFTSSVLVAYARAAYRLRQSGQSGAFTVYDIAPGLLSPKSAAQLRKELL